jgi:hypothetical protein
LPSVSAAVLLQAPGWPQALARELALLQAWVPASVREPAALRRVLDSLLVLVQALAPVEPRVPVPASRQAWPRASCL